MTIAVIPARGGSKRIPRKNLRLFCDVPMIARAIRTALGSNLFDRVVVSTEDDELAALALDEGAEVPFRRPTRLSDDATPTLPVIAHAIESLGAKGAICCLYATTPFVRPERLAEGLQMLERRGASFVFPVVRYSHPIQRALRRTADGSVEMFEPSVAPARSQDLEEAWHDAGQFYWATSESWLSATSVFGPGSVGLETPRYRAVDIDTEEDWLLAEQLFMASARDVGGSF